MQDHGAVENLHGAAQHAAHGAHEAHELPNFVTLLNHYFPDSPIVHFLHQWENILFTLIASSLICILFLNAARKKNLIPEGVQNFGESLVEGISGFANGILGHHGSKHVPFLGTMFFYILIQNWFGLIPLGKSPTAAWSTTVAAGVATTIYVQYTGIKEQGLLHYLKHIAGNPQNMFGVLLIPLMFTLNIILEFVAVPFSLSLRLFANVSSEDRLLLKFAGLGVNSPFHIGILFQIFANIIAMVFSIIQAFVFMLLSTVYISLVLPHGDHHEDHETEPGSPSAKLALSGHEPRGAHAQHH